MIHDWNYLQREIHFPIIINVDDFISSNIISSTSADVEFQTKTGILDVRFVVSVKEKH